MKFKKRGKMEKIKNALKDNKLYIFLLITLLFFGSFIRMEFATDTYNVFGTPAKEIISHFLLSGRMVTALWYAIVKFMHMGNLAIYLSSFAIAIISCTLSLYKLYKIIKLDIKSDIISIILSTAIIINPFSIELFLFLEKGIMFFAILMCICAVEQFIKFLQRKDTKKSIILSILFMLIAVFSYQGVLAIFIALSCIYIIKHSKKIKDFIINNVFMFLCYGIPAVINFVTVRFLFTNERVSGSIYLSESISKVFDGIKDMLDTYTILPKNLFLILSVVTLLIVITTAIKQKNYKLILGTIYITILTTIMTILPIAMQDTASIWFVPRSSYPFASILGLFILTGLINEKDNNTKFKNIIEILFTIILIVLLSVQFVRFNKITIDHYNLNYMDKVNALKIGEKIREYEEKTGTKVRKICIYQDKEITYTYQDIFSVGDINISGFATDWSIVPLINYFNNINLETTEVNEELKKYFSNKNWNSFSEEQIKIEGDTIHFCKF